MICYKLVMHKRVVMPIGVSTYICCTSSGPSSLPIPSRTHNPLPIELTNSSPTVKNHSHSMGIYAM